MAAIITGRTLGLAVIPWLENLHPDTSIKKPSLELCSVEAALAGDKAQLKQLEW